MFAERKSDFDVLIICCLPTLLLALCPRFVSQYKCAVRRLKGPPVFLFTRAAQYYIEYDSNASQHPIGRPLKLYFIRLLFLSLSLSLWFYFLLKLLLIALLTYKLRYLSCSFLHIYRLVVYLIWIFIVFVRTSFNDVAFRIIGHDNKGGLENQCN